MRLFYVPWVQRDREGRGLETAVDAQMSVVDCVHCVTIRHNRVRCESFLRAVGTTRSGGQGLENRVQTVCTLCDNTGQSRALIMTAQCPGPLNQVQREVKELKTAMDA